MEIHYLPAAIEELKVLPVNERKAMIKAFEKLADFSDRLPYPHSSLVQGTRLRELRPRAGRSPWRALYQRVGDRMVVAAICPEAQQDPRRFRVGTLTAINRLDQYRKDS